MEMLVLLLAIYLPSLCQSVSVGNSVEDQLRDFNSQYTILRRLLAAECPEDIVEESEQPSGLSLQLQMKKVEVEQLQLKLVRCHLEKKSVASAVTVKPTISSPSCLSYKGNTWLFIQLVSYHNPTNTRASGIPCDFDGSPCDIFFEICVSPFNSSSCEFYHVATDVVGEESQINLIGSLGDKMNPLKIKMGDRAQQGIGICITVLDKDPGNSLRSYHEVDEFRYNLDSAQGTHREIKLQGLRKSDKTQLRFLLSVSCPSPPTTLPATPTSSSALTTAIPTTGGLLTITTPAAEATATTQFSTALTSASRTNPQPLECLMASNLTQSWRLDRDGKDLKGGGIHSFLDYRWACDLHSDLAWFRFSGAAGTHMLDTCPKYLSCGTGLPMWTNATHPKAVGIVSTIPVYAVKENVCTSVTFQLEVMRCSRRTTHDYIYKYIGVVPDKCVFGFCGMK